MNLTSSPLTRSMLPDEDIDVWRIELPDCGQLPTGLEPCLSSEESARAVRFIFQRDSARFTVAHTALRHILSRYTGEAPDRISILTGAQGKPYLADHPETRFNLSHSGGYALAAVARGREVGVDIECIRPERSTLDIAERFFAPEEVRELTEYADERRVAAFFACWSRKEAYIKARGEGLRIPLDSFEVSLGEAAILRKAQDRECWSMCSLQVPDGYAGALAAAGAGWRVNQLNWSCPPGI